MMPGSLEQEMMDQLQTLAYKTYNMQNTTPTFPSSPSFLQDQKFGIGPRARYQNQKAYVEKSKHIPDCKNGKDFTFTL